MFCFVLPLQLKELQDAQTSGNELKKKGSLLDVQLQKLTEALEAEKKEKAEILIEIQDLEAENSDLVSETEQMVLRVKSFTTVQEELADAIEDLRKKMEQQRVSLQEVQSEKQKSLTEKTQLLIELQELNSKLSISTEREKELKARLEKHEKGKEDELGAAELVEEYKGQVEVEKAAKETLVQKVCFPLL